MMLRRIEVHWLALQPGALAHRLGDDECNGGALEVLAIVFDEDPAGLDAVPYAEYCVPCQAKADGPAKGHTRRKITDYK